MLSRLRATTLLAFTQVSRRPPTILGGPPGDGKIPRTHPGKARKTQTQTPTPTQLDTQPQLCRSMQSKLYWWLVVIPGLPRRARAQKNRLPLCSIVQYAAVCCGSELSVGYFTGPAPLLHSHHLSPLHVPLIHHAEVPPTRTTASIARACPRATPELRLRHPRIRHHRIRHHRQLRPRGRARARWILLRTAAKARALSPRRRRLANCNLVPSLRTAAKTTPRSSRSRCEQNASASPDTCTAARQTRRSSRSASEAYCSARPESSSSSSKGRRFTAARTPGSRTAAPRLFAERPR